MRLHFDFYVLRCRIRKLITQKCSDRSMISQSDKKSSFYPRFRDDLTSCGYEFWNEIKGKGPSHSSKPDYLARKGNFIVIGEIKSPSEGPLTPSWRVPQHSDTDEFVKVRIDVAKREKDGLISRKAGVTK